MKNILLFVLIAGGGWFAWQKYSPSLNTDSSPKARIAALLNRSPIPARELAEALDRQPALTEAMLKNRPVQVEGKIKRIAVFGLASPVVELSLEGIPGRALIFRYDLEKYDSIVTSQRVRNSKKWLLISGRLFIGDRNNRHVKRETPFQENTTATLSGVIVRNTHGNTHFEIPTNSDTAAAAVPKKGF